MRRGAITLEALATYRAPSFHQLAASSASCHADKFALFRCPLSMFSAAPAGEGKIPNWGPLIFQSA